MHAIISFFLLVCVFAVGLSLLIAQGITGVPPLSSSAAESADVVALLKQAALPHAPIIYELGSAWGSLVIVLARAFPEASIIGIELSPFPYWIARFRTRHFPNIVLLNKSFYKCDISDASAVTCYLMIGPMPKLARFLDQMLKPHTPVVSLTFWFRGRETVATRNGPGIRGAAALYDWPAGQGADPS